MKKVLLITMALVCLHTTAQKRGETKRSDYTPEQRATLQTKHMTLALDLNTEQQALVQALHLDQAIARDSKVAERKSRKESEDAKKSTSEERYAMQAAHLDRQIAHKAELKKILSGEQYKQWEKMADRKGKHKKGKGKMGKKKGKRKSQE